MVKIKLLKISEADITEIDAIKHQMIEVPQATARANYATISKFVKTHDFSHHPEYYTELLFLLGEYNGRNEYVPEAQDIFQAIISFARKHNLPDDLMRAQANYAITKAQCGHFHEAIEVWNTILEGDCPLLVRLNLLTNISVGYGTLGELNKAIEYAFTALALAEENQLPQEKISPLINLGSAYEKQGDYEKALGTWREAYELSIRHKLIRRAYDCCSNLSMACNAMGDTHQAMNYAELCLNIGKDYINELELATPYNNIGNIHESKGDLDEALKYYQMAKELYDKRFDQMASANCQTNLASVYIKKGAYEQAFEQLESADLLAKRLNIPQLHSHICELFADAYSQLHRYQEAFAYQKELCNILSRSLEEKTLNSITITEADFYRNKIEKQAEQYRQQNLELTKKNKIIGTRTRELKQSNSHLKNNVEILNWIISVITHDVRAPLANISRAVGMMLEGSFSEDEKEELLHDIKNTSLNLYNLINGMLDGIRLQRRSANAELKLQKLDVVPVLNSLVHMYKPIARHKFIHLEFSSELPIMPSVFDADLLKIVIRNLLDNSIKYTPEKGSIKLTASYEADLLHICIIDNGIGMNAQELRQILGGRKLTRMGETAKEGIGLGLSLSHTSLKKMKARLHIESKPSQGTKITVLLPRA